MASHLSLRGLTVEGPGKLPASVPLQPGLNAIIGATGTGKSYIFQAIDFCLGAGKLHKRPKQAEGYKTAQLLLAVDDGNEYALSRRLDGGKITVSPYVSGVAQFLGAEELLESHDDKKSLSAWLLSLTGMAGLKLFKNQYLERKAFTFRNVAHLTMVDENRIIAEHSPATLGQRDSIPSDQRAFNVMVTGLGDETNIVVAPNKKNRDLQIDGKIDWIEKEVARLQAALSPFNDQGQTPDSKIAAIDLAIEDATSVVTVAKGRVIELEAKRLTTRQSVIATSDRLKSIGERIKQFGILRSFYDTDTERIEATLEAGHAFERLPGGHCAVCGMMPDHATAHADDSIETYEAAARSELAKLERLKTDLDDTLASLRSEQTEQEGEIESLSVSLQQIDREIAELLKPQVTTSADQLKHMMNARAEMVRAKDAQSSLDRLRIEQMELEKQKKRSVPKPPQPEKVPSGSITEFCKTVTDTLRAWRFDISSDVGFDEKTFDMIVNGQDRGGLGKGHRALTHAAFTISIMRYCIAAGLPHPGFVVLDSPLNPFKGITENENGEARVSHEVQDAFYADLANRPANEQYVIIENTEVPSPLISKINHITFSGNPRQPRTGFFPA